MKNGTDKRARHEAIRRIVRARSVATQEELARLLGGEGFSVTQATLSRDLARLGAVRVHHPEGSSSYELRAVDRPVRRDLSELLVEVADNQALVVVRTMAGAAPAVALAVDHARLPECLGTLAGDDTIFVTPRRGTTTRRLSKALRDLFALEVRK